MIEGPKSITLKEHQYLHRGSEGELSGDIKNGKVYLAEDEFKDLRDFIERPEKEDKESKPPLKVFSDRMKALNYVGAILTPEGTQIEILPKIDLGNGDDSNNKETREIFIQMLCVYLGRHHRKFNSGLWGKSSLPLLEVFIAVFLQEVSTLVRRGLARAYISHEENLTCLKGKLDFSNHIKHNLFHKERFYVRYDEFSIDRPINRVIKKALQEVNRVSKDADNHRLANQLLNYFDEVRTPRDWKHEMKISSVDRSVSFKSYKESFEWAQLILQNFSPDNWKGEKQTISLLFPMEKVFESYIEYILEKGFRKMASNWKLKSQMKTHKVMSEYNANGVSFTIIPDLLAIDKNNNRCVILDTKWKSINRHDDKYGISQGDIYQLYSYGKVYQRKDEDAKNTSLVLLYPRNENFQKAIELTEDSGKSYQHNDSLDTAPPLNLKLFPIDLSHLSNENDKDTEQAEEDIAANIIQECIPGMKELNKKAG